MSQDIFTDIDPEETNGEELATLLNQFKEAYVTGNSGASRPPSIKAGGMWVDTSAPGILGLMMYDGTRDNYLLHIDTASGMAYAYGATGQFEILRKGVGSSGPSLRFNKRRTGANLHGDSLGTIEFMGTDSVGDSFVVFEMSTTASGGGPISEENRATTFRIKNGYGEDRLTIQGEDITTHGNSIIQGDFQVYGDMSVFGTTTTLNSENLDVSDANITVNKGGNTFTADLAKAGFTVNITGGTNAKVGYDSTKTSKFVVGNVGSEQEIVTTGHTQTLTNKTLTSPAMDGTPTAPTAPVGTNTTQLATTAFVKSEISSEVSGYMEDKVVGPSDSVDNTIPRYDGVTGKLVQGSAVAVSDTNVMTGLTGITSSGTVTLSGALCLSSNTTNSQTGADVIITSATSSVIRLTSNTLTSVAGYAGPVNGIITTFINTSTSSIVFRDESTVATTATNRFRTGTGGDLVLPPNGSLQVIYNETTTRHHIIGVNGSQASIAVAALNIDWSLGNVFYKSISANSTLTQSNIIDGNTITVVVTNTSGATVTLGVPAGLKKPSTFPTGIGANKALAITLMSAGGNVYAVATGELA